MKPLAQSVSCLALVALSSCTGTTYNEGWKQTFSKANLTKDAVWLGGEKFNFYGIPTREEAYALAKANKGKTGTFVGHIYSLKLNGNSAEIEIIPTRASETEQMCRFSHRSQSLLACLRRLRGLFTSSVVCHVNNWSKLNKATGGTIAINNRTRKELRNAWDHILVEGIIERAADRARVFNKRYSGYNSANILFSGPSSGVGFAYQTIHIKNCRILTYRGQVVTGG